ncbi:restriction endonuclease subunit S [Olsenella uli]|uniref:restriction endonuclease subunit S n=1 Tax=Olsenella uli TaxID=133926 RepID=UPI0024A8729D|nr:restriction endonuclease subunit S [Olsenella uli]
MGSLQLIDNVEAWVEAIPKDWRRVQLKHVVVKLNRMFEEDAPIVICTNKGTVDFRGENNPGLVSLTGNGYQGVEPGDLLIHGMDTWHGAIAVSGISGQCTSVVHVCDSLQNKRFIAYYLRALSFRGVYKAFSNGVRQNTSDFRSWAKAGEIPIILPPREVQDRIANYLDEKCAEIDRAVDAADKSIEEYKAYRNSVILQAVTKGLDPDAHMRDSGIEWLGKVPKGWEILEQKWLMRKVKRICAKWSGESVLSLTTAGVIIRDVESGKGKFPATFDGYQYISSGNLVLCLFDIDVTPRCVGLAECDGVISPAYSQYEMLEGANSRYYNYYLRAIDDRKLYLGLTSTLRHSLTPDLFGQIKAVRPPLDEQLKIADFLDAKCLEIDRAIYAKQSIIEDLKAYKQSLIFEVVTGKREV